MEAFAEVNEIIKLMPLELVKKIPRKFREMIVEEKDNNYIPDIEEPIEKCKLKNETIIILGLIYRDFLCSPDERKKLQEKDARELQEVQKAVEEEIREVLNSEFLQCLSKSVTYQVLKRIGVQIEEKFNEYSCIKNKKTLLILGTSVNKCSSDILRIVEHSIRQNKEENKYEIRKIWSNSEEKFKRDLSNEVRRVDSGGDNNGQIIGERTGNSKNKRNNNTTNKRAKPSSENKRVFDYSTIQSNDREFSGRAITTNARRENLKNDSQEVEKTTSFSLVKNIVSETLIDKAIKMGSMIEKWEERVKDILTDETLTNKEQIQQIKKEYGFCGGTIGNKEGIMTVNLKGKGIDIEDSKTKARVTISWSNIIKRLKNYLDIENVQLDFFSEELKKYLSFDKEEYLLIGENDTAVDFAHLIATTQSYLTTSLVPKFWTGWGGDLATAMEQVKKRRNEPLTLDELAYEVVCSGVKGGNGEYSAFNYADTCSDADAIKIAELIDNSTNNINPVSDAIEEYYSKYSANRYEYYVKDIFPTRVARYDIYAAIYYKMTQIYLDGINVILLKGDSAPDDVVRSCCKAFANYIMTKL